MDVIDNSTVKLDVITNTGRITLDFWIMVEFLGNIVCANSSIRRLHWISRKALFAVAKA